MEILRRSKAENLPEEMIDDILYRLPLKSIGRCRCVSKQWYNFLSDPKFIKTHFNLHAHKQQVEEKLIFVSSSHDLYSITLNHDPQNGIIDGISRKIHFQEDNWYSVAGSCNGLVLLENQEHSIFLMNPTTLEYHRIPNSPLALPSSMYGLGYDLANDDYKVVSLSRYRQPQIPEIFVDVYSAKLGRWRRLANSPYDDVLMERGGSCGVLVNGVLHWLAAKETYPYVIVSFDLSDEKFLEVPTPAAIDKDDLVWYSLRNLKGCLCMFSAIGEDEIDVWVMREYRVNDSWTTFRVAVPDIAFDLTPLLLMRDDLVLDVDGQKLIVYNKKEQHWRDMMVDGAATAYETVKTFIESLISPTFGRGTRGYFIA